MKIAVLDRNTLGYDSSVWNDIEKTGEIAYADFGSETTEEEIIDFAKDAEVILLNKIKINKRILEALPKLKLISVLATGYNVIDIEAAKEHGVVVCNVPSYSTMSVCQHTIGLILEICNRIGHHDVTVHDGKWVKSKTFSYWDYDLIELEGKTLGIIGYGTIGKAVAGTARTFGMNILAYTPHPGNDDETVRYVDLDTLFAKSDIITLHCRLNPQSENLINKDNIAKMKDGAILINTSRGQVINEADVAEALKSGKLAAAAVDVVSAEPIHNDNPLLTAPNCIITPHIAWTTKEARERLLKVTEKNILDYAAGHPCNIVNK